MKNRIQSARFAPFSENDHMSAIGELAPTSYEKCMPDATCHLPDLKAATKSAVWEKNTRIPYVVRNDELSLEEFLID